MPLRHGQTQNQRDAHGQRDGDLEGGDAVGQREGVFALDEVVGRVVDACAGHEGEDAGEQKDRYRRFERMAKSRDTSVSGMTAMREAAAASAPYKTASS